MALNLRSSYEELLHQLQELRREGYIYVGEHIFASAGGNRDKVNDHAFHLTEVRHGDLLDRIVMLFSDMSGSKVAMLVIEKDRVYRSEGESSRFLVDTFRTMGEAVPVEHAEDLGCFDIGEPVRLIYRRPLFLTLLYHCNLIVEGHNFFSMFGGGVEQRNKQMRIHRWLMNSIRKELVEYFALESWDEQTLFQDYKHDHSSLEGKISQLSRYLDGLQVIRDELKAHGSPDDTEWEERCRHIDQLIASAKGQLTALGQLVRVEVPYMLPERTIALWCVEEAFPKHMGFAEMIAIRTQLEHEIDRLSRHEPLDLQSRRDRLWQHRRDKVDQQLLQLDKVLEGKLNERDTEWEDYFV